MVTITRPVFINNFQMEHFSAVEFAMGYEKNRNFLVIQNLQKFEKKKTDGKIGLASYKMIQIIPN